MTARLTDLEKAQNRLRRNIFMFAHQEAMRTHEFIMGTDTPESRKRWQYHHRRYRLALAAVERATNHLIEVAARETQ